MAANPDPSPTPPAEPQPPSGNGSHPEPSSSTVPTLPVKPAVPAAANAKTPAVETVAKCLEAKVIEARVVEPNVLEVKLLVEQAAKKDWKTTWWARMLISSVALAFAAFMLWAVLTIFSVSQVFPYTEWMMYRFKWHEGALYFFCLLLVTSLCFLYTAQSLLKNSLEGKGQGGTAFNLNLYAVGVMGGISVLALFILMITSPCEQPYVIFKIGNQDQVVHSLQPIELKVNTWEKVTVVTDQDNFNRVICVWEKGENTEISETKTCTVYVQSTGPGRGVVTLKAHTDVCNSPERIFNLVLMGAQ